MHATRVFKAVVVAISVLDAAQAVQLDNNNINSKDVSDAVAVRADKSMSIEKGSNVVVPTLAGSDPSPSPSPTPDMTSAEEPSSPTPKVPPEASPSPPTSKDGPSPLPSPSSPLGSSPTPPVEAQPSSNPASETPGPNNDSPSNNNNNNNNNDDSPTPAQPSPSSGNSFGGVNAPPASGALGGGGGGSSSGTSSGGSASSGGTPGTQDSGSIPGSGTPSGGSGGGVVANPGFNQGSGGSAGSPGSGGSAGFAGSAGSGGGSGGNASPSQASSMTTIWTPVIQTEVAFVTKTNSDGSTVVTATTTVATHTMPVVAPEAVKPPVKSKQTRNTIVGVVVGVGGAIVLGALGLVAFRIWGRKKHAEEADGLMDYHAELIVPEKSERGSSSGGEAPSRNPFQSTLENYHQPMPVNASSNF